MKIAFIGHSYHQHTRSSDFFIRLLTAGNTVDFFWDESWQCDAHNIDYTALAEGGYDKIIVWQQHKAADILTNHTVYDPHNILYIPMYDDCRDLPDSFLISLRKIKVLSFCRAVQNRFEHLRLSTKFFQYYPDPAEFAPVQEMEELSGFFWQRKEQLTWQQVRQLLAHNQFAKFNYHGAVDPSSVAVAQPDAQDIKQYHMEFSQWFATHTEYLARLRQANLFVAPRLAEGIGHSFLEAMAMGMAVVATDSPTMNEYITHQVNGYLFDMDNLQPLHLQNFREIGKRARESVIIGYRQWQRMVPEMLDYVLDRQTRQKTAAISRVRRQVSHPLVSVAVVTRNARNTFADTLSSIAGQTYDNMEIIVVDGASTDGTVELIQQHEFCIDRWISEPDQGPYDAMNKAAEMARGRWILFMNAGDSFADETAVAEAMAAAPQDADFIFGHHIYLPVNGIQEWHKANDFTETWERLKAGKLDGKWLSGVPGHQATFTRVSLLREHCYNLKFKLSADHEFMYRMKALDRKFYHANVTVAKYVGGGMSAQNLMLCINEWEAAVTPYVTPYAPLTARCFFPTLKQQWGVKLTWLEWWTVTRHHWQTRNTSPRKWWTTLLQQWRVFMRWFLRINLHFSKGKYSVTFMGIKVLNIDRRT